MNNRFPQYTTDYISGVMSLRTPQKDSLKILENIMNSIHVRKGMDLRASLDIVKSLYPTCTDFERDFMSLTFSLATGVGKTRLMGAFIAYLYTRHNMLPIQLSMKNCRMISQISIILNMCSKVWGVS